MNLVLVLGDQLTSRTAALKAADRTKDLVVLAEVTAEAAYVRHHPKKIALIFAAMRKFADRLRKDGWQVAYARIDDPDNAGSIPGELLRHAKETGASRVIATEPGEWRLGYSVTAKSGDSACPFNILYWHFLIRHRDRFESNPRMAPMYRTRDGKDARSRQQVLQSAEVFFGPNELRRYCLSPCPIGSEAKCTIAASFLLEATRWCRPSNCPTSWAKIGDPTRAPQDIRA